MEKTYIALYVSYRDQFQCLTKLQLGELLFAIYDYECDRVEPDFDSDPLLRMMWLRVKGDLDAQQRAIDERNERNRENGKKGGRPRKDKSNAAKEADDGPSEEEIDDMLELLDFSIVEDDFKESFIEWIRHKLSIGFKPTKSLVKKEYKELIEYSEGDIETFKEIVEAGIANNNRIIPILRSIRKNR